MGLDKLGRFGYPLKLDESGESMSQVEQSNFKDPTCLTKWTKWFLYAQVGVAIIALISEALSLALLVGYSYLEPNAVIFKFLFPVTERIWHLNEIFFIVQFPLSFEQLILLKDSLLP